MSVMLKAVKGVEPVCCQGFRAGVQQDPHSITLEMPSVASIAVQDGALTAQARHRAQ